MEQYLIYGLGNCASLSAMLWFKFYKKDEVRKDGFKLFFFVLTAYLTMQIGRWLLSLPFVARLDTLIVYLTTDIISLLFATVVMFLMRNTDGMIEDQKAYLFRLQREQEEKGDGIGGYGTDE